MPSGPMNPPGTSGFGTAASLILSHWLNLGNFIIISFLWVYLCQTMVIPATIILCFGGY